MTAASTGMGCENGDMQHAKRKKRTRHGWALAWQPVNAGEAVRLRALYAAATVTPDGHVLKPTVHCRTAGRAQEWVRVAFVLLRGALGAGCSLRRACDEPRCMNPGHHRLLDPVVRRATLRALLLAGQPLAAAAAVVGEDPATARAERAALRAEAAQ